MTPESWLAEKIKEKGLKQKYVADKANVPGLTRQKLSAVCSGRRHITVEEYIAVCKVIGVSEFDYPLQKAEEGEAERAGA